MDDFCSSVMFNTFNALSTEHLKIKVTKLWSWFEKSYPRDPRSWSSLVLKENLRLLRLTLFPLNISATARASSSTRNTIHGWKLHIVIFLSLCYVSSYTLGTTGCYWPACKSLKYTICCMSKFVYRFNEPSRDRGFVWKWHKTNDHWRCIQSNLY